MFIHLIYIISIFLAIVATYILTRLTSHRQLLKRNEALSETNERLKNENAEYEERTKDLLEKDIRPLRKMREEIEMVAKLDSPTKKVEALQELFVIGRVWPKGKNEEFVDIIFSSLKHELESIEQTNRYLEKLHELIDEFYDGVNSHEVRNLNDWDKAQIRANLLRLAFQLMDGCQSINYFNHVRTEHGINNMLINNECSPIEAEAKCKPITDLETETPRWARVLKSALAPWLANEEMEDAFESQSIILRGYLFNKNKNQ